MELVKHPFRSGIKAQIGVGVSSMLLNNRLCV
jgi:hypothetical protein